MGVEPCDVYHISPLSTYIFQVYYQCTQRAKLGCGALCHVVYHHSGTALLYTNGEPHNHIEYNTLLGRNSAANVAIDFSVSILKTCTIGDSSFLVPAKLTLDHIQKTAIIQATPVTTILGLTPLALTHQVSPSKHTTPTPIVAMTPASASSPTPTSTPSASSPSSQIRNREDWTPVTMFTSYDDAKEFLEQESLWKFSYSHSGVSGRKVHGNLVFFE